MMQLLETIYQGESLNYLQATESFQAVLQGRVEAPVVAAMLAALKTKGESVEEIAGAAYALRQEAVKFPQSDFSVSDCCGTGGDGLNTINVSSIVSILAATAGVKIVKHGNRSVSSKCGSADLMEQLDINIHVSPEQSKQLLDDVNFSFLFAPDYHPGVKHVMPIRQSLKTRTIFNLIGPLANPALPEVQLLGVYDKKYCRPFAEILKILGAKKALVVHGSGLDEIAVHDSTFAVSLDDGVIQEFTLSPENFGISRHSIASIQANDVEDNVAAAKQLLKGQGSDAHIDMVAVNCGALLVLNNLADDFKAGTKLAKELLKSGQAYQQLQKIKEASYA
ncbi:anthranilate phosphoribosyltransferase [Kangiella koreensis]|nr:anthranilate phosphoribosyltransferase [Kangiella koreensis]